MFLIFWNFFMLCLGVGLIIIIVLGTYCDYWIWWFLHFIRFRKISVFFFLPLKLLDRCWIFLLHSLFLFIFISFYHSVLLFGWFAYIVCTHAGWENQLCASLPNSTFSNVMLEAWNLWWYEYLYHGNQ